VVAYSFRKQFALPILDGSKRQTIRSERVRGHAKPGDRVQLYTGMRTRYCRLLGTAFCASASQITIDFAGQHIRYQFGRGVTTVFPGGLDAFANNDGFADWAAMHAFWTKHHPGLEVFDGVLIRWTDFVAGG
jgi:hypothetical protein